jgi:hypothetical protein
MVQKKRQFFLYRNNKTQAFIVSDVSKELDACMRSKELQLTSEHPNQQQHIAVPPIILFTMISHLRHLLLTKLVTWLPLLFIQTVTFNKYSWWSD